MQLFHFWSRDAYPVQNLLLCTKFHRNRMIFRLRYGDISIFKMAAVRHLGIVLPPITKSLLLAAAACQISCQSDTQIWRYSYLNFSHWFEMPIQAPKMGVLGDFGPLNVIIHHRDPPKGTSSRKSASYSKLPTVKIRWGVWPVGELTESVTQRHTQVNYFINILSMHSTGQTIMMITLRQHTIIVLETIRLIQH